jgi:hypothetical protein
MLIFPVLPPAARLPHMLVLYAGLPAILWHFAGTAQVSMQHARSNGAICYAYVVAARVHKRSSRRPAPGPKPPSLARRHRHRASCAFPPRYCVLCEHIAVSVAIAASFSMCTCPVHKPPLIVCTRGRASRAAAGHQLLPLLASIGTLHLSPVAVAKGHVWFAL